MSADSDGKGLEEACSIRGQHKHSMSENIQGAQHLRRVVTDGNGENSHIRCDDGKSLPSNETRTRTLTNSGTPQGRELHFASPVHA